MRTYTDHKYAKEMLLTPDQVRRMLRTLDVPFVSSGSKDTRVFVFDRDEMDLLMEKVATNKRETRGRKSKK